MREIEKVILRNSPEAAQEITIKAWKSSNGRVFFDEHTARYDGSTHDLCSYCGKIAEHPYTACKGCRDLKDIEKYEALPKAEWDGTGMLYSDALDRYYSDIESAEDDLEEGQTLADLRLLLCKSNYARQLDGGDFEDDLPENDGELPEWLSEAIEAFNKAVEGKVLSWSPGKVALKVEGSR